MSNQLEEITLLMPKGTRGLLKDIKEKTGLNNEDVLKLGFRYLEAKQNHEIKKSEAALAAEAEQTPSNMIAPNQF